MYRKPTLAIVTSICLFLAISISQLAYCKCLLSCMYCPEKAETAQKTTDNCCSSKINLTPKSVLNYDCCDLLSQSVLNIITPEDVKSFEKQNLEELISTPPSISFIYFTSKLKPYLHSKTPPVYRNKSPLYVRYCSYLC